MSEYMVVTEADMEWVMKQVQPAAFAGGEVGLAGNCRGACGAGRSSFSALQPACSEPSPLKMLLRS